MWSIVSPPLPPGNHTIQVYVSRHHTHTDTTTHTHSPITSGAHTAEPTHTHTHPHTEEERERERETHTHTHAVYTHHLVVSKGGEGGGEGGEEKNESEVKNEREEGESEVREGMTEREEKEERGGRGGARAKCGETDGPMFVDLSIVLSARNDGHGGGGEGGGSFLARLRNCLDVFSKYSWEDAGIFFFGRGSLFFWRMVCICIYVCMYI